ncbi:hypothetical protein ATE92_1900 [Ulvibacter sp. MAR_2010_11]|uniref:hypothetical protein n=1 Tax=Ulvibacter sp. MAR_2010_11 TaxID=1250229 RepID=UPI000CB4D482|nr:hypothetical protein [Ulvibacter sp. MAR_2010_11]PKA83734.1 hypothetical protein ATE92_1900 [Ulvibacter sp. MAR_2010_11]
MVFTGFKSDIGIWVAINATYTSAEEPYQSYGMEWTWGIGQASIIGRLYGIFDGKESGDFWQFRQYWDNVNNVGVLVQFGHNGITGIGTV